LFSLFRQTGEVVSEIEDTFGDYGYGDQIQEFADSADTFYDEFLDSSALYLKEHIPKVQTQIARILDGVPEVSDYLSARIDEIPDEYRAQLGDGILSLMEIIPIPELKRALDLGYFDAEVDGALRVLPSKMSMKGFLKVIDRLVEGDDWAPAAKDRVKERLDDVLKIVDTVGRF